MEAKIPVLLALCPWNGGYEPVLLIFFRGMEAKNRFYLYFFHGMNAKNLFYSF
jgi:hypothetical protein